MGKLHDLSFQGHRRRRGIHDSGRARPLRPVESSQPVQAGTEIVGPVWCLVRDPALVRGDDLDAGLAAEASPVHPAEALRHAFCRCQLGHETREIDVDADLDGLSGDEEGRGLRRVVGARSAEQAEKTLDLVQICGTHGPHPARAVLPEGIRYAQRRVDAVDDATDRAARRLIPQLLERGNDLLDVGPGRFRAAPARGADHLDRFRSGHPGSQLWIGQIGGIDPDPLRGGPGACGGGRLDDLQPG